jgi:hypothetical protein
MAASCCSVFNPSGPTSSAPALIFFSVVDTRIMKNSSRFDAVIARNFTRSSSGWLQSRAWSSTRSLNSSQLSSRLMYSPRLRRSVGAISRDGTATSGGGSGRRARRRVLVCVAACAAAAGPRGVTRVRGPRRTVHDTCRPRRE